MQVSRLEKNKKHKSPKRRLFPRILGLVVSIGLALTLIAGVVTVMLVSADLPPLDLASISNYSQTAVVLDKNGAEISRVSGVENRIKANISQLPDHLIKAVLAVEDTRFYTHHGIDLRRIAAALWVDIKTLSFSEGASTITQQVVKNSQLTQEKKVSRKITEALLALQLERLYSKDEILEAYLNIIPYGEGVYGVETAAQLYFGKSASDLTLSESALLAGIPKSPTYYSPFDYPDAAKERRNLILRLMNEAGYISEAEMRTAQGAPLEVAEPTVKGFPHGYFVDYVLDSCQQYLDMTRSELIESGYTIETTMDLTVQNKLEEIFSEDEYFPACPAQRGAVPGGSPGPGPPDRQYTGDDGRPDRRGLPAAVLQSMYGSVPAARLHHQAPGGVRPGPGVVRLHRGDPGAGRAGGIRGIPPPQLQRDLPGAGHGPGGALRLHQYTGGAHLP